MEKEVKKRFLVVDDDEEEEKSFENIKEDEEEKILYLDKDEGFFESVFNEMKESIINYNEKDNEKQNDKKEKNEKEKNEKEDFEVIDDDKKKETGEWEVLG